MSWQAVITQLSEYSKLQPSNQDECPFLLHDAMSCVQLGEVKALYSQGCLQDI